MKVKVGQQVTCKRCGFRWHARITELRICPECKSARFDQPRCKTDKIRERRL